MIELKWRARYLAWVPILRSSSSSSDSGSNIAVSPTCELGITLYQILFEEFGDAMQRQEIVGRLVTHVGSGLTTGSGGGGITERWTRP